MNHKGKMQYLKANDPITYYELTGNPTGSDENSGCFWFWVLLIIVGIVGTIITN